MKKSKNGPALLSAMLPKVAAKRDRKTAKAGRETPDWIRVEDRTSYAELTDVQCAALDKRKEMYEDGAPIAVLTMTPEQRKEAWVKNPPAAMPRFDAPQRKEDPSTIAFRAELEAKATQEAERKSTAKTSRETKSARVSREGLVSVASIAGEYGLIPRLARGALRAAKVAKPPQGWMFAAGSELEETIRAALASAKDTTTTPRAKGDPRVKKSKAPKVENAVWSGTSKERAKWRKQHAKLSSKSQPATSSSEKPSSKQSTSSTKKTKSKGARSGSTTRAKSSPKQSAKKRR